jgi:hypothetical protein
MEVVGKLGTERQINAMGLEESATGGRFMQGALDSHRDPGRIGKFRANPEGRIRKEGQAETICKAVSVKLR